MDHLGLVIKATADTYNLRVPFMTNIQSFRTKDNKEIPNNSPAPSFHLIPEYLGYTIKNGDLFPSEKTGLFSRSARTGEKDAAVQRWLFFELLRTVLGDLPGKNGRKFRFEDFIATTPDGRGDYITTEALPEYLRVWEEYETDSRHQEGQMMRLVQVQSALHDARRFVYSNCAAGKTTYNLHLCLSFLVLGETLSAAFTRILEINQIEIHGWYGTSSVPSGWGYSQLVLDRLQRNHCCPSILPMLKSLFRDNTIGLLLAMPLLKNEGEHVQCTDFRCTHGYTKALQKWWSNARRRGQARTIDLEYTPKYEPKHTQRCIDTSSCQLRGPNKAKLAEVIDSGKIPILRYHSETHIVDVEALGDTTRHFAIFSHVWEHGFGNPESNEMYECQLEQFQVLIGAVKRDFMGRSGSYDQAHAFWIDTLAIPVGKDYERLKKLAIGHMHKIYRRANYTIVLDEGLIEQTMSGGYAKVAMMITVSKWMTRLWTLQEAALSKEIYFNFNDEVYSIDKLEKDYLNEQNVMEQSLANIARTYYHNMLGSERENLRKHASKRVRTSQFVANVWRAAQWRDTAHAQHETLALAILLGLDTEPFSGAANNKETITQQEKDERMKCLLQQLAEHDPCLIPAGMIFLPGPRLDPPMFGWAPRSWLSHRHIGSPDPLEGDHSGVSLVNHGLNVKFPGFDLLNISEDSKKLCSRSCFRFPADAELLEWYTVTNAEDSKNPLSDDVSVRGSQLAIIAINLPMKQSQEIALLVTMVRKSGQRYRVHILNRVYLKLENDAQQVNDWRIKFRTHDYTATTCGAKILTPRKWCVDGPHHIQPTPQSTLQQQPPRQQPSGSAENNSVNQQEPPTRPGASEGARGRLPNNKFFARSKTFVNYVDDPPSAHNPQRPQLGPLQEESPFATSSEPESVPNT